MGKNTTNALLSFFQGFINLDAAVMLPAVIATPGRFFHMKPGQVNPKPSILVMTSR